MPQKVTRLLVLFLAIGAMSGCGAGGGAFSTTPPPVISTITLSSTLPSIAVSGTEQITATAKDGSGNILSGVTFNWASSTPSVAAINGGSGAAMGLLPGTTQITASANGITSAPATLTVTPGFLSIVTLNVARTDMTMTVLNNGMVLVAGGSNSAGITATAELYNPATRAFTLTGSLNTARYNHTATLLENGTVLIAGGADANFNMLASAELYNPANGTFTPTGNLIVAREQSTATHLQNGMVLIAGGNGLSGALATAELYDPTTAVFMPAGNLNVTRRIATATRLNDGTVLIAGGVDSTGAALASAELYEPKTGTFTLTGSMTNSRAVQTATLLNSGMVLLAGGAIPNGAAIVPLASAEIYNPATRTFAPTGSLSAARTNASATLLNNGTVLFAGGDGPGSPNVVPLTSAEVFDPTAGTFTATGSLGNARVTREAPLLPNGMVLLAGGFDLPGVKAPAELYEPATFTPPGLVSITVGPASPTISPGAYQQYVATGTFAGGATQQLTAVAWSTSEPSTAQISNDATNPGASVAVGSPTATAPVTITAAAGTISGTAILNVRPAGFVDTGSMKIARNPSYATRLNTGLVLVADSDGSISTPLPAELYDPATGTFSFTGSPITSRINFFTATLLENGKVLIAGGFGSNGPLANAELYDPVTGLFTATGSMNTARYSHTAALLVNGTVLITGGRTSATSPLSSAEIFDPGSGMFTPAGNMSVPRSEHTATPIAGGNVLIAGGESTGIAFPANAEVYDAFSGTFSTVGSLNAPRSLQTATLLPDGMVLIAGGLDFSQELSSAELYNPATGKFTVTGSMSTPRTSHSATLLNSGMVLVAGGGNNLSPSTGVLATTELYNPLTGTFANAAPLNAARINHAATLLDNGMVLIVGGANAMILSSAELY